MEIFYDMIEEWVTRLYAFVKIHQTTAIKICVFRCIFKKTSHAPSPTKKDKLQPGRRSLPAKIFMFKIYKELPQINKISKQNRQKTGTGNSQTRKQLKVCSTSPAVRKTRQHFVPFGCTKILKSGNTEHW